MSPAPRSLSELYRILMDLQQECVDAGSFGAAYHVLAGALHCAEAAGDIDALVEVVALAKQRQEEIDGGAPPHALSSAEASRRGTTPLFASLAVTAQAVRIRLHAEEVRAEHETRRQVRRSFNDLA
jgi:hypothetical protein